MWLLFARSLYEKSRYRDKTIPVVYDRGELARLARMLARRCSDEGSPALIPVQRSLRLRDSTVKAGSITASDRKRLYFLVFRPRCAQRRALLTVHVVA